MDLLTGINATSGALNAQKTRLDIIGQNIANAHTTRGPNGLPYQRQVVTFETELLRRLSDTPFGGQGISTVRVGSIVNDTTPGQRIYQPDHPDADAEGMLSMPNVNMAQEMVDLITSSRTYEANLSVVKSSRQMAMKTLEIGRT
jgi:flagellar basal-body rod protein FlgC